MNCRWCSFENLSRARFCGRCGRTVRAEVVGGTCTNSNPADHSFCDECGAALTTGLEPAGVGGAPAEAGRRRFGLAGRPGWVRLPRPALKWERPAPQWEWTRSGVLGWVSRNRLDLAAVVALTIVAGLLRIYRVAEVSRWAARGRSAGGPGGAPDCEGGLDRAVCGKRTRAAVGPSVLHGAGVQAIRVDGVHAAAVDGPAGGCDRAIASY